MKRNLLVILLLAISTIAFAQKQISGKVVDDTGEAVPGANVIVKGTTEGTTTDLEGNYRVNVPEGSNVLIYSFIGLETKEVEIGQRSVLDITLNTDVKQLAEVVVTALGVEKEQRRIGYAATQVDSKELTQGRDRSLLNSLQGKVAGLNITSASGQPGSSSRVILRGLSSLGGSNQPLFVIDGVPMNNSQIGSGSLNGGVDFGNRINDLNPEDIASITVLKGGAGSALYGSRAGNGVILITTKKGQRNMDSEINFSSSVTFDTPLRLPEFQNQFGQGFFGQPDYQENTSWGPAFDGELRPWGNIVDNQQRVKPYVALPDNVKDFFDVGKTFTNNVSFRGGNESNTFYLSYSNVNSDGFIPTDNDSYNRHTFAVRGSSKLTKNLTASGSVNFITKTGRTVLTGQDQSTLDNLMQTPRDISVKEHEDYHNPFNNLDNYYSFYTINPYYTLNEHGNTIEENRTYGNISLTYNIKDYLKLSWKGGADIANTQMVRYRAITQLGGTNAGNGDGNDPGSVRETSYFAGDINSDLILTYSNTFNDFSLTAFVGNNIYQQETKRLDVSVIGLDIPYFYDLSNSSATPTVIRDDAKLRLLGVYGSVDLGYRNFLFLTLNARNDWSSVLPEGNKSFFYGGASTSFVFTDAFNINSNVLSFGKVRVGVSQTGRVGDPYQTTSTFVQGGHTDGFRTLQYPLMLSGGGTINGFEVSNIVGNPDLNNELVTEYEIGADLRFFNGRIGLDANVYSKTTTDLVWNTNITPSTGATSQTLNLGEINNKGIELLLTATPVQLGSFSWDISANYAKNKNELVSLNEDLPQVDIGGLSIISLIAKVGQPIGLLEGPVPLRDSQGRIVVASNGLPVAADDPEVYGDVQYDYVMGISNSFSYKGLRFSFLFDIRQGGLMYSRTADLQYFSGTAPITTYNNREPFIVSNSVVDSGTTDENGNPIYVENTTPVDNTNLYTYWGNGGDLRERSFVISKSFIKLRELAVNYSLPKSILGTNFLKDVTIGVVGRNLWIRTPKSQTFIDPEAATLGNYNKNLADNDIEAEFGEYSAFPSTRSIGFNLRLTF